MEVKFKQGALLTALVIFLAWGTHWIIKPDVEAQTKQLSLIGQQEMLCQRINLGIARIAHGGKAFQKVRADYKQWASNNQTLTIGTDDVEAISHHNTLSRLKELKKYNSYVKQYLAANVHITLSDLAMVSRNQSLYLFELSELKQEYSNHILAQNRKYNWLIAGLYSLLFLGLYLILVFFYKAHCLSISNKYEAALKTNKTLAQSVVELEGKNDELSKFTYHAAHDLKEPLNSLELLTENLISKYGHELDDFGKKYLNLINQSSADMGTKVEGLLNLSRIGNVDPPELVDTASLIDEVKLELKQEITNSQTIISCSDLPKVNVVRLEMKILFKELIYNAIKFRKDNLGCMIEISADEQGGFWNFCVEDNGIGISASSRTDIFKLYHKLNEGNSIKGTGMGLAICKKIVESHGGLIWVKGHPGKGAQFFFSIPA